MKLRFSEEAKKGLKDIQQQRKIKKARKAQRRKTK